MIPNPALHPSPLPHGAFPFHRVTTDSIREAVLQGISEEEEEIQHIITQQESPNFHNTIIALEESGQTLGKALTCLYLYLDNATTDSWEQLAQELSPQISRHNSNILFNRQLFQRIETVWKSHPQLLPDEERLFDRTYHDFLDNGIHLSEDQQNQLADINEQLEKESLDFSRRLLQDTNRFSYFTKCQEELDGLLPFQLEEAAQNARQQGKEGWTITLKGSCFRSVLSHCTNQPLRRKIWLAYNHLGCQSGPYDNRESVRTIVNLRRQKARLLGYSCYAALAQRNLMAKKPSTVKRFLHHLVDNYKPVAMQEQRQLKEFASTLSYSGKTIKPWDTAYYARLLKKDTDDIDMEELRPYLALDNVLQGIFQLARRLFGISFQLTSDIPAWNQDVQVYEVYDSDKTFLALLYLDLHTRQDKRSGAWTFTLQDQKHIKNSTEVRPHVGISTNFSPSSANRTTLLSWDETTTLLHEFGHALHDIFSRVQFASQAGTHVSRDFVELPSQFMENYMREWSFVSTFAFHHVSGKLLPQTLFDKAISSFRFRSATACMRQLSFGLLDMAYHSIRKPLTEDIISFEKQAWKPAVLSSSPLKVCMTTQFQHIMCGGYAARYYSYKWSEVLDADAFSLFQEKGVYSREAAERWRKEILEKGSSEDPHILYRNFRGRNARINAMLERDGIINTH